MGTMQILAKGFRYTAIAGISKLTGPPPRAEGERERSPVDCVIGG